MKKNLFWKIVFEISTMAVFISNGIYIGAFIVHSELLLWTAFTVCLMGLTGVVADAKAANKRKQKSNN